MLRKDQFVIHLNVENTAAAVERGAFGVPTFYIGGEMYFGKERMAQVEEQISAG